VAFVREMRIGPILARIGSGATEDPHPGKTSRRITGVIYDASNTH
jgi:hypothetical protein